MKHLTKQVILVDIDLLLDTRLAILSDMNFSWVEKHLNEKYRHRFSDHWDDIGEGIDQDAYDKAYAERDVSVLQRSRLTNMVGMLSEIVRGYEDEMIRGETALQEIVVVINTYPYELTNEEKHRILQCLTEFIGSIAVLRVVEEPPESLSIPYLKYRGYTQMAIYDFNHWLSHHYSHVTEYEAMAKDPSFVIVAPRRKHSKFNPELYQEMKANNVHQQDEFELAEAMLASMFRMTYIPIFYASLFDPDAEYNDIIRE